MNNYHNPVMLEECIEGLKIVPSGTYVDVTYGGGGHSKAILSSLGDEGVLLVFDQDKDALGNRVEDSRLRFCEGNFKYLRHFCSYYGVTQIDGLLADLGVSSHHLDESERGFSFRFGASNLDMRMNPKAELTAADILNTYDQPKLAKLFRSYGDLDKASPLANSIVDFRSASPLMTTADLEEAVKKFLNKKTRSKTLAKIFQAIRIEVNEELGTLEEMLEQATDLLSNDGRLVVMSYHSMEDRVVKNLIQTGNVHGERNSDVFGRVSLNYKAINKKPILASTEEVAKNSRARSAKLRVAKRVRI